MRWICPWSESWKLPAVHCLTLPVFLQTETEGLVWIFHVILNCKQMIQEREGNWIPFRNIIKIFLVLIQGQFVFPAPWFRYPFTDLSPESIYMYSTHYNRLILFLILFNLPSLSLSFILISLRPKFFMLRSGGHNIFAENLNSTFLGTSHSCLPQEDVAGSFWAGFTNGAWNRRCKSSLDWHSSPA